MSRAARDRSQDHLLGPLGDAIRQARIVRGVSQEKLANITGIERSHMGRIERGEANVSFLNLMKIAEALQTRISEILKLVDY